MKALSSAFRRQLERVVADAREVAEVAARAALEALAVSHAEAFEHMGAEERNLRRRLRAHGRQLGDRRDPHSGGQGIDRLVHECAYEHWHGMLFARFLAENNLLIEPEVGVAVTLGDCEELGKERGFDKWMMAAHFAHEMLPQVFRPAHPVFEVRLAREHRLKLEGLVESLPADVFLARDSLGWVYQFWQSRKKDEVNRSGSKIGADELPTVTQLFTEPYMVSFLLDNSLGAWWAARRLSKSDLNDAGSEAELRRIAAIPGVPFDYLRFVRREDAAGGEGGRLESTGVAFNPDGHASTADEVSRPASPRTEDVARAQDILESGAEPAGWHVAGGALGDWPERLGDLRVIDPCCGSGHFLVAAFAMLVPMRMDCEGLSAREAVDAVLRENLHGLELDPRCVELAAFALALAAWTYPEAAAGAFVALLTLSRGNPDSRPGGLFADVAAAGTMHGLDVSEFRTADEKAARMREVAIQSAEQTRQLKNPDSRIVLGQSFHGELLEESALAPNGMHGGDSWRFRNLFWETPAKNTIWRYFQTAVNETEFYGGREHVFYWPDGGRIHQENPNAYVKGRAVWGQRGVVVRVMRELPVTLYDGDLFDISCVPIVPRKPEYLLPIWCFCSSPEYNEAVRRIDQKLNVTNATLAKVPFDLDHWTKVAEERYPNGLPRPYSDDPTQWIFHGHPCGSVVWDETEKWTAHGPLRTDPTVLQVAVARLLGYRWPAEQDDDMELADEQREWVRRSEELLGWADEDSIVCIPSVRGEPPADERLLELLAAACGDAWNEGVLAKLLAEAGGKSLDYWLRSQFFEQHCKLFHHRPFVWHIWDGRKRDGFHALVSYHKLAEGDGKGRRLLESLTFSYLGDWITRQQDGVQRDEVGAADRLAAAKELERRLVAIIEGEKPFDIFVRWKPVHEQPIGWEPDINDGVRLNIRPFMAKDIPGGKKGAGILRTKPNVHWRKDRGKDPLTRGRRSRPPWLQDEDWDPDDEEELRPQQDFPWFWCDDEFTGQGQFLFGDEFNRINELSRDAIRHQIRLSRSRNWRTINRLNKNWTGGRLEQKLALVHRRTPKRYPPANRGQVCASFHGGAGRLMMSELHARRPTSIAFVASFVNSATPDSSSAWVEAPAPAGGELGNVPNI